jgi:hypothetical protein
MKKLLLPALVLLFFVSDAQDDQQKLSYDKAISFSPLMLLGPDYTLTLGYEQRLNENIIIFPELGYIIGSSHLRSSSDVRHTWGFQFRPSVKILVNRKKTFYLQPQLFYKRVDHRLYDWLGKDCVDEVPSYEELKDFTFRRKAYGFNAIAGVMLPNRSRKLIFDFYWGLGVRFKESLVPGEGRNCFQPFNSGIVNLGGNEALPNMPMGMRLVFVLGGSE